MSVLIENRASLTDKWLVENFQSLSDSFEEALPEDCLLRLTFEKVGLSFRVKVDCVISGRDLFTAKSWVPCNSFGWHQLLVSHVIGKLLETLQDVEEPTCNKAFH